MKQVANMLKNYIGVDIGGTSIKGIIINRNGDILYEDSIATGTEVVEKNNDSYFVTIRQN